MAFGETRERMIAHMKWRNDLTTSKLNYFQNSEFMMDMMNMQTTQQQYKRLKTTQSIIFV